MSLGGEVVYKSIVLIEYSKYSLLDNLSFMNLLLIVEMVDIDEEDKEDVVVTALKYFTQILLMFFPPRVMRGLSFITLYMLLHRAILLCTCGFHNREVDAIAKILPP